MWFTKLDPTVAVAPSPSRKCWDRTGRLSAVQLPDGRRVEHHYDGGYDRMTRMLRGTDGEVEQRTVYLSPDEELRFDGEGVEYRKTVFLGAERVAEVRIGADPGVVVADFDAPAEVARELPAAAAPDGPAPPFGYEGDFGVLWLLAMLFMLIAVIRRFVALRSVRRGFAVTAALAVLLSCGGSATNSEPDDDVVFGEFVPEGAELVFLHSPRLGTPVLRTDADGEVLTRSVSTPFGVPVQAADDGGDNTADGAASEDFRFTDKEWDADTGYVYFGARYYEPSIARWISPDPLVVWGGGGIADANSLAYVGNAATVGVDAYGLNGCMLDPHCVGQIESDARFREAYERGEVSGEDYYRALKSELAAGTAAVAVFAAVAAPEVAVLAGFAGLQSAPGEGESCPACDEELAVVGDAIQAVSEGKLKAILPALAAVGLEMLPGQSEEPLQNMHRAGRRSDVPPSRPYDRQQTEVRSGVAVTDRRATDDWDEFLGPAQTNIDPRDGMPDPDRIWSEDGTRSIRFGDHEMNGTPNNTHYHRETWTDEEVHNELQRVQQTGRER